LGSESGVLILELGSEGVIDRRAIDEGPGKVLGDLSEVAGREVISL
jgi:hypothetical protein